MTKELTKSTATVKAKALCKLLGKGWKPRVWENLGWHYSARNCGVEVYAPWYPTDMDQQYFCHISDDIDGVGSPIHWVGPRNTRALNPKLAVARAVDNMNDFANEVLHRRDAILAALSHGNINVRTNGRK